MENTCKITCIYNKTYYRDEKTGKCAFTVKSNNSIPYRNSCGNINCFGYIPFYNQGFPLVLEGVWEQNKKGTYYLKVLSFSDNLNDTKAIIDYLKDDAFYGIGEILATNILNYTGNDIYKFVTEHENAAELIVENIKGVTQIKVANLIAKVKEKRIQHDIYNCIHVVGGNFEQVDKLFALFNQDAVANIQKNPYICYKADMPFPLCDALAFQLKKSAFFKPRLCAIVYAAINRELSQGHTWLSMETLFNKIHDLEKESPFQLHIHPLYYLTIIKNIKHVITYKNNIGETCVTLDNIFYAEKNIVDHVIRLENSKKQLPFSPDFIQDAEKKFNIQYGESQKKSFMSLATSGVKNITGGPGTGKTTVINGFIYMIKKMYPNEDILLLAPTGRASQRMKETTNHVAYTIHKGIEYMPFSENGFAEKNKNNPFTQKFIIVDEMSMVGAELMAMLLDAVENGSALFLFGDADQLPSVEIGNVFHDLLQLPNLETYRLTDTYRQEEDSAILYNARLLAKDILLPGNQSSIDCHKPGNQSSIDCHKQDDKSAFKEATDFEIYRYDNEKFILPKLQEIVEKEYNKEDVNYLQVLSPIKKKKLGCFNINKVLQSLLNPLQDGILYNGTKYRENDKVIFLINNYELGYYNGDIGVIAKIEEQNLYIDVNGEEIELPKSQLNDIDLAYAVTIHKSQGSEFPVVVIVLTKEAQGMLNKNLLFTAITRASRKVIILTEGDALEDAAKNLIISSRRSNVLAFYNKQLTNHQ